MSKLFQIFAVTSVLCVLAAEAANINGRYNAGSGQYKPSSGQYNPGSGQYRVEPKPYYSEYQRNKQYYDNFYRKYNPNVPAAEARIVEQVQDPHTDGSYTYTFETENGIHAEERGVNVVVGKDEEVERVEGSYSYITPEGIRVGVRYTADETGYHPTITYDGVGADEYAKQEAPAGVVITQIK